MADSSGADSAALRGKVADYFVVVGASRKELRPLREDDPLNANDPLKQCQPLHMVFETEVVSRYPMAGGGVEFPDGLALFCMPDGLRVTRRSKPPMFFSFVQTSDRGRRLVGSCLTFYEKLNDEQRKSFLDVCTDENCPGTTDQERQEMRLYAPRCLCIISQWPFVQEFRQYLCHIYRLSLTPCSIPIERFICNFIDDVPVPPSGLVEVSYIIPGGDAGADSSFVFKRPPINEPNAWNSLPIKSLFECLSVSNILSIFASVLTERKVVFISSQNHLVSSAAETIVSLMYPLQWSHVYIPILPRCLLGVLNAPVPFIVGLNSAFLPSDDDVLDENERSFSSAKENDSTPAKSVEQTRVDTSRTMTTSSSNTSTSAQSVSSSFDLTTTESSMLQPSPRAHSTVSSTYVNTDEQMTIGTDDTRQNTFVDDRYYAVFSPDTVQVYLDEDRVDFGELGPPPPLPERRRRKLHTDLVSMAATKCFDRRPPDWKTSVLPFYDSAYKMSVRPDMVSNDDEDEDDNIDEKSIRGSFLKFFVSILQNYRKYLVYPSKANPFPRNRFKESEFLSSSESDWRIFLRPLLSSQAFHQFVDVRLSRSGWTDPEIIFFDESIDAKINRYTFRLRRHDTPFLTNESTKHAKTHVAPTVDLQGLDSINATPGSRSNCYVYTDGFPELQADLFVSSSGGNHHSNRDLFGISGLSSQRLRRASTIRLPFSRKSITQSDDGHESTDISHIDNNVLNAGGYSPACVFSTFLTLWGSFISTGLSEPKVNRAPPTMSQLMGQHLNINANKTDSHDSTEGTNGAAGNTEESEEFTLLSKSPHKKPRGSAMKRTSGSGGGSFVNFDDDLRDEFLTITRSAIKIAFELFGVMMSRNFAMDANVYRTLANACAVCGAGDLAIELLRAMLARKVLPDRVICASIAGAISFALSDPKDTDAQEAGDDFLLIAPKDVHEAAMSNNVKSLVKRMQLTRSYQERENDFEDMLLAEYATQKSSKRKSRFSFFQSSDNKSCNDANTLETSNDIGPDDDDDGEFLATVGAASPRLRSQILLAERTLDFLFPDLEIDVNNPYGTTCPNFKCGRALLMPELMENYKPFDANAYTVKCPHCGNDFVPRFTVHSSRKDWVGSEGPDSLLWCELLSPWVLQKEIMTIIEDRGIKQIVSKEFKTGFLNPQYAVLFWNLIVSFRLYGLPYAFLICEKPSLAFLIPLD